MTDQERAIQLANIINKASKGLSAEEIFENGQAIKTKFSNSAWYNSNANERSMYVTYVLASVLEEAKELQSIRKANQDNFAFDFEATNYTHVIERQADHANYEHNEAIELELVEVLTDEEQAEKEAQQRAEWEAEEKRIEELAAKREAEKAKQLVVDNKATVEFFEAQIGNKVYSNKNQFGKVESVNFHQNLEDKTIGMAVVKFENGAEVSYDKAGLIAAMNKAN